jgi:hypothetical protein
MVGDHVTRVRYVRTRRGSSRAAVMDGTGRRRRSENLKDRAYRTSCLTKSMLAIANRQND